MTTDMAWAMVARDLGLLTWAKSFPPGSEGRVSLLRHLLHLRCSYY